MSIQDIPVSQNMKKKLINAIQDETVMVADGSELVVNVGAYKSYKVASSQSPIEEIIGEGLIDDSAEFIVFS